MTKAAKIIFIVIVCLLLVIPVVTFRGSETYSSRENRNYTALPKLTKEDGSFNTNFPTYFDRYYSDHLGFRNNMISIYSNIMVNGFGLSSNDKIVFGKNGWMFYTANDNVDIGMGKMLLNEAELRLVAENQTAINNYYKSLGKEYYLIFTPSKASVYSEMLPGNYTVGYTVIDQVTDYLRKNTDVKVINTKQALIDAKGENDLYLKTDTHWNPIGSYQAYKEIVSQLKNDYGIDIGEPTDISFVDSTYKGEFSNLLGDPDLLSPESYFDPIWERSATQIVSGTPIDQIKAFNSTITYMDANTQIPELYHNEKAAIDKKVLLYVDSMWRPDRGLPWYLSEHYSDVVYTRIRKPNASIDKLYDPDIVIFSCVERFIPILTGAPADIPQTSGESYDDVIASMNYEQYPKFDTWTGRKGFCIDDETAEGLSIKSLSSAGLCVFKGWAVDFPQNSSATDVYVRVGGKTYKAIYGIERAGIVSTFGHEEMRYSGFELRIPSAALTAGETIQFIMVNQNTGITYQPAEYTLIE